MTMPSMIEIIVLFATLFFYFSIIYYPAYYFAKKKNLSLGWNVLWSVIFGPLWWIVMFLREGPPSDEKIPPNQKEVLKIISIVVLFIVLFGYMYFLINAPFKISDNALLWLTMFVTTLVITIPTFAFVSFDEENTNSKFNSRKV